MDSYREFAEIYDELMNDIDYESWFNYIKEIYKKNDIKPNTVLEMACGTGSLTKFLCNERYDVTCFDLSEEMLSIAYDKLKRFNNVKILNQNMIDFKLNRTFDSIISICDSINYIVNNEDLVDTFKNVYNHLNDDGVFIFDINSYYKLTEIIGNNIFIEDNNKIYYSWQNYFDENENLCYFDLTFFIKKNDSYIRFDEEHIERAYTIEEIVNALKTSGFSDVKLFEAFTFNSPVNKTERINFVAFK